MRYGLPALPASGPARGKRARRREAARLALRQGSARRSGKTSARLLCPTRVRPARTKNDKLQN
jgi:hypothetical protein